MMKRVGHITTYPGRREYLPVMLESVVSQLDDICVVLNQFNERQKRKLPRFPNVRYVIPEHDLKDTGKFYETRSASEYVFTLDDDLEFPSDYVATLIDCYESLPTERAVVGLRDHRALCQPGRFRQRRSCFGSGFWVSPIARENRATSISPTNRQATAPTPATPSHHQASESPSRAVVPKSSAA
jgi:hypothetical protein